MNIEMSSCLYVLLIGVLFWFSSPYVSSQSDSCSSALADSVSNLIPFSTSSLNCTNAWSSQSFILRVSILFLYGTADMKTITRFNITTK
jgi:hypothetical protein